MKYMFSALCASLMLLAHQAFAQDTLFRDVQLAYGISLNVPSHWTVLSLENRKNINSAGQAIMDNAGTEGLGGQKETLLAMNAMPYPTGAMIRVSVSRPLEYTQSDLAEATPADLKEVGAEVLKNFQQIESSGGPKIIEMRPVRIESLNNRQALVMSYIRAGLNGSSWMVSQYKIPVANFLVELTLSHRQSDAIIWRPILERVRRSINF